jgi:polyisoprenoid-binding protein YceI
MKTILAIASVALALPLVAVAASQEGAKAAGPTTFEIDPVHSSVTFRLRHLGVAYATGRFNTLSGELTYDAADASKCSVSATVDPASVDTNNDDRDAHLRAADFFEVEKHTAMTFASKRVERVDDDTFRMTGTLTYRGVEQPLTAEFDLVGETVNPRSQRRTIGFTTTFQVDRAAFGDTYGVAQGSLGGTVEVRVDVEASEKR